MRYGRLGASSPGQRGRGIVSWICEQRVEILYFGARCIHESVAELAQPRGLSRNLSRNNQRSYGEVPRHRVPGQARSGTTPRRPQKAETAKFLLCSTANNSAQTRLKQQ